MGLHPRVIRAAGLLALTLSGVVWAEDRSALLRAGQHLEAGDPKAAVPLLQAFLQAHGPDAEAYTLLGAAFSQAGNRRESNRHLRKALELSPRLNLAIRLLGVNAFDDGDFTAASTYFNRLLALSPSDEEARVFLAQIALAHDDFGTAIKQFRLAKTLLSRDAHLQILMARALVGAKQFEQGRNILQNLRSDDPIFVFEAGRLLLQAGDSKGAVERLISIRETYPARPALEYNLALAWFRSGDYQHASSVLEKLVQTREADADVYNLLGDAYRRQNRMQAAFDSLRQAVFLAPEREQPFVDLLSLCVELVAIDPGLEISAVALKQHPASFQLYAQRAQLYSLKGELGLAETDYKEAIRLSPKTDWLHLGLAMSLILSSHLQEARTLIEARLPHSSGYYLYYLYSEVLSRLGLDRSGAPQARVRQLLERAVSLNPTFAPCRINLGRIYKEQKEWGKAIAQFRAATVSDPLDKRSWYELARIYQETGDGDQARAMLAHVRQINEQERERTPEQNAMMRLQALQRTALREREK